MKLVFEDYGIEIRENKGEYYLTYDEGGIVTKDTTIKISKSEAIKAQKSSRDAHEVIIKYQNQANKNKID